MLTAQSVRGVVPWLLGGRQHRGAFLVCLVTLLGGSMMVVVGYVAMGSFSVPIPTTAGLERSGTDLFHIVMRNMGVAAMLFSGVVTAGLTTLLAGSVLGLYTGAMLRTAVNSAGVCDTMAGLLPHFPVEYAAFLLAAVAGLSPVSRTVMAYHAGDQRGSLPMTYLTAADTAMRCGALAMVLLVVAAGLEVIGGIPG